MEIQHISEAIKELLDSEDTSYAPYELYTQVGASDGSDTDVFYKALGALEKSGDIVYTKKGKVISVKYSGVVKGIFRASMRGFGFVTPIGYESKDRDIFISSSNVADAIDGDTVLVTPTSSRKRSELGKSSEGRITKIISRGTTSLVGTLLISRGRKRQAPMFYVVPDNKKLSFNVNIDKDQIMNADVGDKVEVALLRYPSARLSATGRVVRVFGESDSLTANYDAILHGHKIKTEFPKSVLEQADRLAITPVLCEDRLDLREKNIFTIDGIDAKDLDDAISIDKTDDGYVLGVHIADVSHYVTENSALDTEAMARGTSVYFADKVVPMLPKALSNGICSLNAGVDRYALSAFVTLDKNGQISETDLKETVINSKVRGVYSELNDFIENGDKSEYYDKYKGVEKDLSVMLELYKILEKKSFSKGALDIETTESKIIVNDNNEPIDIVRIERGTTEKMIEQFMLCANEGVATRLFWQDIPCVYRIHEEPDPEKIRSFELFAQNLGLETSSLHQKKLHPSALSKVMSQAKEKGVESILSNVLLRSLMKAKYSHRCSPHFGLAIDRYCHFTSPIRRYPDLATHRIIKMLLRGKLNQDTIKKYDAFAAKAAIESSENEIKAQTAERDIEDLYKCVYMTDKIGQAFEGIITGITSFGFFVELENTCEGLVPITSLEGYYEFDEKNYTLSCNGSVFSLGMRVEVLVEDVDIITRKVDMLYIGKLK